MPKQEICGQLGVQAKPHSHYRLKDEFERQLRDAWIVLRRRARPVLGAGACDLPKGTGADSGSGIAQIGVVEQIKVIGLEPE